MKNGIKHIIVTMLCVVMTVPQIALAQAASQAPLINQSWMGFIPEGGASTLGFVIGGTAPRTVLIRVVGPGMSQLGVGDTMPNPRSDIFRLAGGSSVQVFGNDNWQMQNSPSPGSVVLARATTAELPGIMASVGAFGPLSPNDSAVAVTLAAGNYTVRGSSGNSQVGTSGNVIIEVYLVE